MDEFERVVTEVEKVVYDESFTSAMEDLRADAHYLVENPLDDEEAYELKQLLEQQWTNKDLFFQKMQLTGTFYKSSDYDVLIHTELDEDARVDLNYHPVKITGFAVQAVLSDKDGHFALRQQLLLTARTKIKNPEAANGVSHYEGYIPVTDEMRLDYDAPTPEKAKAWLSAYYPELKNDVDDCILSAEDEGEATTNLVGLDFDFTDISKKERKNILKKLGRYVNDAVKYEVTIPYRCEVSGEFAVFNTHSDKPISKTTHDPEAAILAKELLFSVDDEKEKLRISLSALIDRGKGQQPVITHMPISSIYSMETGRPFYERTLE